MPTVCPHCSARWTDASCQDAFDRALSLEFTDAAYGAVHHLTVSAFMLQHDRYSHRGWLAARSLLEEFVRHGLDPTDARERWPGAKGSSTRGPGFARFGDITWTRTMADVRMDDPGEYGEDVAAWALSVLEDSTEVAADGD